MLVHYWAFTLHLCIFFSNTLTYSKILLDYALTSIFSESNGTKVPTPTHRWFLMSSDGPKQSGYFLHLLHLGRRMVLLGHQCRGKQANKKLLQQLMVCTHLCDLVFKWAENTGITPSVFAVSQLGCSKQNLSFC